MPLSQLRGDNRVPITTLPQQVALEEDYDATVSTSTQIAINASANLLEVTAIGASIFYKWNGTASSTDFDGIVPLNSSKLVPIPVIATTIDFIEEVATAKLAVVQF